MTLPWTDQRLRNLISEFIACRHDSLTVGETDSIAGLALEAIRSEPSIGDFLRGGWRPLDGMVTVKQSTPRSIQYDLMIAGRFVRSGTQEAMESEAEKLKRAIGAYCPAPTGEQP